MTEIIEHKLKKAIDFEMQGNYLHSLQIYRALLEEYPDENSIIVKLVLLYEKMNYFEKAIEFLDKYILENPGNEDIILFYADLLIRNYYYDRAVDILTLISGEQKSLAKYMLALSYYNLKEYEIAKINFETFIEEYRGSGMIPDAYVYLAKTLIELNKIEDSLNLLKKAEKIFSLNSELYQVLAQVYYHKEMYFHAYEAIKKTIKLSNDITSFEWAGKILIKMGEFENAEKYLRNSLDNENPKAETYSLLGLVYLHINKNEKARECFGKALELDPENQLAKEAIIKIK